MGLTGKLASDLNSIQTLSDKDKQQLKLLIIDYFAAAYAGYRQNQAFNQAVEKAVLSRKGVFESCVFMQTDRYPAESAAFMNAVYGHGADIDDGNKQAAGHAGVHIIPAVFALADKLGSKTEDVFLALATGYEAFIRISSAAQPGMVRRGFHGTGMAGSIACAAACAKLYQMDETGIEDAMALATTMSSGLLSYGDSRPAIKPLNPAKAAENGLLASILAHNGVKGPAEALEGPNGWFHAVTDEVDESFLAGKDYLLIHDCYFKLYPSCRHTHCGIDAAIRLHEEVKKKKINSINLYIYPSAIKLAGIKNPRDRDEGKFSIPYTLASALQYGRYGIDDMDPELARPEVLSLLNKIHMIPDSSLENREKGIRGAKLEIHTPEAVFEETILIPKGEPENPLDRKDIIEKLRICAGDFLSDEQRNKLIILVEGMKSEEAFQNPMGYVIPHNNS